MTIALLGAPCTSTAQQRIRRVERTRRRCGASFTGCAAVSAIKKVYYAPLGNARRRRLREHLDAQYDALFALTNCVDLKIARAALRALPPVRRPKPSKRRP